MGAPPCMQHAPEFNASRTTTLTASKPQQQQFEHPAYSHHAALQLPCNAVVTAVSAGMLWCTIMTHLEGISVWWEVRRHCSMGPWGISLVDLMYS